MRADVHFLADDALHDDRLADYRDLRDRPLAQSTGRFVVESEMVVRKLLESRLRICSILLTAPRLATLAPQLDRTPQGFPTFVVPQTVMDRIAGFHVHRGCLAIAERPLATDLPADASTVVVLVDLVDVDNLGAMIRNAAAFGADAVLLSPRCADPYYRKAVRTSAGAVLSLPIVRADTWPEPVLALRRRGIALVGAVLDDDATPLDSYLPPRRLALLLGAEGPGLDAETKAACDALVTIPMARTPGVDSLNVATAGAVFLYHLLRVARR